MIRSTRTLTNVPAAAKLPLVLIVGPETRERAIRWDEALKRLARVTEISFAAKPPKGFVQMLVRGESAALPLADAVDLITQEARLRQEIAKVDIDIKRVDAKLGNEKFVANAPEDIVEEEKEKRETALARKAKLLEAIEQLKNAMQPD